MHLEFLNIQMKVCVNLCVLNWDKYFGDLHEGTNNTKIKKLYDVHLTLNTYSSAVFWIFFRINRVLPGTITEFWCHVLISLFIKSVLSNVLKHIVRLPRLHNLQIFFFSAQINVYTHHCRETFLNLTTKSTIRKSLNLGNRRQWYQERMLKAMHWVDLKHKKCFYQKCKHLIHLYVEVVHFRQWICLLKSYI